MDVQPHTGTQQTTSVVPVVSLHLGVAADGASADADVSGESEAENSPTAVAAASTSASGSTVTSVGAALAAVTFTPNSTPCAGKCSADVSHYESESLQVYCSAPLVSQDFAATAVAVALSDSEHDDDLASAGASDETMLKSSPLWPQEVLPVSVAAAAAITPGCAGHPASVVVEMSAQTATQPPPPPPPLVLDAAELTDPGIKSFARAIARPGATHQHAFWLPDWCGRLSGTNRFDGLEGFGPGERNLGLERGLGAWKKDQMGQRGNSDQCSMHPVCAGLYGHGEKRDIECPSAGRLFRWCVPRLCH